MQALFEYDEEAVKAFRASISEARFSRYIKETNGDVQRAIKLYRWNSLLSQSLYLPLQTWEITLRNRINNFLVQEYNPKWPYDERVNRMLARTQKKSVDETKARLDKQAPGRPRPTDAIVADLTAGFWVGLLGKNYEVSLVWRRNLRKILPHAHAPDRERTHQACRQLLLLRNRVAHHEPILQLDLPSLKIDMDLLISGMCATASGHLATACTFSTIWDARPV